MATRSNRSATARTVRALRGAERITDEHAGLVRLAETTAAALDEVVASAEKRYVVAQLARAHLLAMEALLSVPPANNIAPFDRLLEELSRPSEATETPRWE
jgi:hypothetical protein